MLLISAIVLLVVLVYSVGQGVADRHRETPVSIFHPSYLILSAGVFNAFIAGDLFNLYVGFEILLVGELRAAHARRHRRAHPRGRHVHHREPRLVAVLPQRDRADLRRHRHGEHRPALGAHRRAAAERAAHPAPAAAHRVRHQGGDLPAVVLAARLVPDRARTGHRGVRRPAHEGRRLRDHPHRDGDLRRGRPRRCCSWSSAASRWSSASSARSPRPTSSDCSRSRSSATSAT